MRAAAIARRQIDVIDVNRGWIAYVGSAGCGYSIGTVLAASRALALAAARMKWPDPHRLFVSEIR